MVRSRLLAALWALLPVTALASDGSLRGSAASMSHQHEVAIDEDLTFSRTPGAVLAEVAAGTLTELTGNADYRVGGNVSFAYAVPEVRVLVERLGQQYRNACGEQLVVTSLTRPRIQQPRNAHALSVHPAGMAVDLRVSRSARCRGWLEGALLSLEAAGVLDVTREHQPPHYHVAVFPTLYREYVQKLDASKPKPVVTVVARPTAPVMHKSVVASPRRHADLGQALAAALLATWAVIGFVALLRSKRALAS